MLSLLALALALPARSAEPVTDAELRRQLIGAAFPKERLAPPRGQPVNWGTPDALQGEPEFELMAAGAPTPKCTRRLRFRASPLGAKKYAALAHTHWEGPDCLQGICCTFQAQFFLVVDDHTGREAHPLARPKVEKQCFARGSVVVE